MISFLRTVETGLLGLFLFKTSLTLKVINYTLRVTILKKKFSKIESRLQQRSGASVERGANE